MRTAVKQTSSRRRRSRQSGFSLIELMVSVVIFLVVMGALYSLLRVGASDRFTTNQRAEILQSARSAMNQLGREITNAGYEFPDNGALVGNGCLAGVGLPNDNGTNPDTLPVVFGRNDVTGDATVRPNTDQMTIATIDDTFYVDPLTGTPQGLTIGSIGGTQREQVTIQNAALIDRCSVGELYIVSKANRIGWCTQIAGATLTFAPGDVLAMNSAHTTSPTYVFRGPGATGAWSTPPGATLRRVRLSTYFVTPQLTLVRRAYSSGAVLGGTGAGVVANAPFVDMPLAEGVEDFQIEYIVQNPLDPQNRTLVTSTPTVGQLIFIRQIRVTMTVRGPEIDPRTRDYSRATTTATYNTRNILFKQT